MISIIRRLVIALAFASPATAGHAATEPQVLFNDQTFSVSYNSQPDTDPNHARGCTLARPRGEAVSPVSILIAGPGVGQVWLSFPGALSGLVTLTSGDRRAKGEARTNGQDTIVSMNVVPGDWRRLFDAMPTNNLMVVDANNGSTVLISLTGASEAFHALVDCVARRENQ